MATFRNRWERVPGGAPWVIAHRGDSAHAPENTLLAGRLGREAGASAWELDVQMTRDGVPVVVHDPGLARTTDVGDRFPDDERRARGYPVGEFTWGEIRSLDAGAWFLSPSGGARTARAFGTLARVGAAIRAEIASGSVRVPRLDEVLALTRDLDWAVNVELKSSFDGREDLARAVLAAIAATGTADRVLVSSFDHVDVARVARSGSDVATAVLTATPLFRPGEYVRRVGAGGYHPSAAALGAESAAYRREPSAARLRRGDVDDIRRAGLACRVYTVNDPTLAAHLAEIGVDGVFSDDPAALIPAGLAPPRRD